MDRPLFVTVGAKNGYKAVISLADYFLALRVPRSGVNHCGARADNKGVPSKHQTDDISPLKPFTVLPHTPTYGPVSRYWISAAPCR